VRSVAGAGASRSNRTYRSSATAVHLAHLRDLMSPTATLHLVTDDHAHLSVEQLPLSAHLLGCGRCGLPAQEHGRSVIHRFARPDLPAGYRYLDEVGVGDELALRRRPAEQSTIVVVASDAGVDAESRAAAA
jgi:hypothetical protein